MNKLFVSIPSAWRVASGCALTAVIASQILAATTGAAADAEPKKIEKMIITGSNIPTAADEGVAPVATYRAEDIERVGARTIEQLFRTIPTVVGGGNFGVSRGNGGDGTSQISLRGIPDGTLVLINGRRVAPNGRPDNGANVDLNAIPLAAIDRIEILKDGGSAIYGADAIAGVFNIITRKDYNGAEFDAYYGNTTDTDVGEMKHSFIAGISNEKTSILVGGQYYKANGLFSRDRERSQVDVSDPLNTSPTSNPGRIMQGTLGTAGAGLVYRGAPGTTGTNISQYSDFNGATDRFPFPLFTPAIRPSERYSLFANAEHQLIGETVKFFTEGSYTRTLSFNQLAPTPIVATAAGTPELTISSNHPYNPFGINVDNWRYRTLELGPRTEDQQGDVYRFVAGLKGQIPDRTWQWETAVLYSEDSRFEVLGGDVSQSGLATAIQRTGADAFNPFGNQANGSSQLLGVGQELLTRGKSTMFILDGKVNGEVFDLPGGPFAMAIGAERREEKGSSIPDRTTVIGDSQGFNQNNPIFGSRVVESVYAEGRIPVLGKDFHLPFMHSVEITAAGRYDSYSDFGDTWVPKAGIRWEPLDDKSLTLRATYSESFKAPRFQELYFQGESFPELRNPVTASFDQIDTIYSGNPNLNPETAINYTAGFVWSPKFVKGFTMTADWFRIEHNDIVVFVDQFIIDQNFAGGGPTNPLAPFATNIVYNPATQTYEMLFAGSQNIARRVIEGVDASVSYELPTENCGKFTFLAQATYFYRFEQEEFPGSGLQDKLGDFVDPSQGLGLGSIPRWKGNVNGTWDFRGFTFGATVNYIGRYKDDVVGTGIDRHVKDQVTVDLQASYRLPWQTRVTAGVINVTDEIPPLVEGAFADKYDRDTHDLRQRFWYVSLNKKF